MDSNKLFIANRLISYDLNQISTDSLSETTDNSDDIELFDVVDNDIENSIADVIYSDEN
jgi:hypothetical protein